MIKVYLADMTFDKPLSYMRKTNIELVCCTLPPWALWWSPRAHLSQLCHSAYCITKPALVGIVVLRGTWFTSKSWSMLACQHLQYSRQFQPPLQRLNHIQIKLFFFVLSLSWGHSWINLSRHHSCSYWICSAFLTLLQILLCFHHPFGHTCETEISSNTEDVGWKYLYLYYIFITKGNGAHKVP